MSRDRRIFPSDGLYDFPAHAALRELTGPFNSPGLRALQDIARHQSILDHDLFRSGSQIASLVDQFKSTADLSYLHRSLGNIASLGIAENANRYTSALQGVLPAHMFDTARLAEPLSGLRAFDSGLMAHTRHYTSLLDSVGLARDLAVTPGGLHNISTRSITDELHAWQRLAGGGSFDSIAGAAVGWSAAIDTIGGILSASRYSKGIADHVLAPARLLTRFSKETSNLLERTTDVAVRGRLEAASLLVGSEIDSHVSSLGVLLANSDVSEDDAYAPATSLVLPSRQRKELLTFSGEVEEPRELLEVTSIQANASARRIVELVLQINLAARHLGKPDIFKLTNRFVQALTRLPYFDASTEHKLGDVADDLYFVIYEGAGKDHLRYLNTEGGPLGKERADIVFKIKHFRNKWLRHDAEHGSEGDIRKSYEQLRAALLSFGFSRPPRSGDDFRRLQNKLLSGLVVFLEELLEGLDHQAEAKNQGG